MRSGRVTESQFQSELCIELNLLADLSRLIATAASAACAFESPSCSRHCSRSAWRSSGGGGQRREGTRGRPPACRRRRARRADSRELRHADDGAPRPTLRSRAATATLLWHCGTSGTAAPRGACGGQHCPRDYTAAPPPASQLRLRRDTDALRIKLHRAARALTFGGFADAALPARGAQQRLAAYRLWHRRRPPARQRRPPGSSSSSSSSSSRLRVCGHWHRRRYCATGLARGGIRVRHQASLRRLAPASRQR